MSGNPPNRLGLRNCNWTSQEEINALLSSRLNVPGPAQASVPARPPVRLANPIHIPTSHPAKPGYTASNTLNARNNNQQHRDAAQSQLGARQEPLFGGNAFHDQTPTGVYKPQQYSHRANTTVAGPSRGMHPPVNNARALGLLQTHGNPPTPSNKFQPTALARPIPLSQMASVQHDGRNSRTRAQSAMESDSEDVMLVGETGGPSAPPQKRQRVDDYTIAGVIEADGMTVQQGHLFLGKKYLGQGSVRLTKPGFTFSPGSTTFPVGGRPKAIELYQSSTYTMIAIKYLNGNIPDIPFSATVEYDPLAISPHLAFIRCVIFGPIHPKFKEYLHAAHSSVRTLDPDQFRMDHGPVVQHVLNQVARPSKPAAASAASGGQTGYTDRAFYTSSASLPDILARPTAHPHQHEPLSTHNRPHPTAPQLRHPNTQLSRPTKESEVVEMLSSDDDHMDVDPTPLAKAGASAAAAGPAKAGARAKRPAAGGKQRPIKEFFETETSSTAVARARRQAYTEAVTGTVNLCSDEDTDADADADADEPAAAGNRPAAPTPSPHRSRAQRPATRSSAAAGNDTNMRSPKLMIEEWMMATEQIGTKVLFTYPFSGVNAITITPDDAMRLEHWEYLNDNLLEWYFRVLLLEKCRNRADEVHIFNTFFYTRLKKAVELEPKKPDPSADPPVNQEFERVLRFCKKVDLFTKRIVIVPINENLHWYLAVIVNPGKLLVDPPELATVTRDWLKADAEAAAAVAAGQGAASGGERAAGASTSAGAGSSADSSAPQQVPRNSADGGIVGMDTTTSALGDEDMIGDDVEATSRPVLAAASDKVSVVEDDDDESGSTTPRASSPPKNGGARFDQDSPTHSGFASSALPSPQLSAADMTNADMEVDMPASDSSMHTKAGRWDAEGEDDGNEAVPMSQHAKVSSARNGHALPTRPSYDDPMQMDDSIIFEESFEPMAVEDRPSNAPVSKCSAAVDGEITETDEDAAEKMMMSDTDDDARTECTTSEYFPKAPSKTYNARPSRPNRPTTSLPLPANIPRTATPLGMPVAPSTPLPESKTSTAASSRSPTPTATAAAALSAGATATNTTASRTSGSSKDNKSYDPDNDVLIVVLDSLNNPRGQPANFLEKYLKKLAHKRGYTIRDDPPIHKPKPKSPRQPNSCDCGVYLLHYVERLLVDTDRMIQYFARQPGVDAKALWVDDEISKKRVAMTEMVTTYADMYLEQVKSKAPKQDEAGDGAVSDHDEIQEVVSKDAPEPAPAASKNTSGGRRLGGRPKAEVDAAAARVDGAEAEQHRQDMFSADFLDVGAGEDDHHGFAHGAAAKEAHQRASSNMPPLPNGYQNLGDAPSPSSLSITYATRDRFSTPRADTPLHSPSHVTTRHVYQVFDSDDDNDATAAIGNDPIIANQSADRTNPSEGYDPMDLNEGDEDMFTPPPRFVELVKRAKFASGAGIGSRPPQPPTVTDPFAATMAGYRDAADDDVSADYAMSPKYQSSAASHDQSHRAAPGSRASDPPRSHGLPPLPSTPYAQLPDSTAHRRPAINSGELVSAGGGENSSDDQEVFDGGDYILHAGPVQVVSEATDAVVLSDTDDESLDPVSLGTVPRPAPKSTTGLVALDDDGQDDDVDPCGDPSTATRRFTTPKPASSTTADRTLPSKPTTKYSRPIPPARRTAAASAGQSNSRPASPALSSPINATHDRRASSSITAAPVAHAQVDLTADTDDEEEPVQPPATTSKPRGRSAKGEAADDSAIAPTRVPRGRGQSKYPERDLDEEEQAVEVEEEAQPRRSTRSKPGSVIEKRMAAAAAKKR